LVEAGQKLPDPFYWNLWAVVYLDPQVATL